MELALSAGVARRSPEHIGGQALLEASRLAARHAKALGRDRAGGGEEPDAQSAA